MILDSIIIIILCLYAITVGASTGDIDPDFRKCAWDCIKHNKCKDSIEDMNSLLRQRTSGLSLIQSKLVSAHYYYTTPNCIEDCQYTCSFDITQKRRLQNQSEYKYYGHWVFYRPYGFHEPASSFFSICNAIPHIWQIVKICTNKNISNGYLYSVDYIDSIIKVYPFIATITWFASALYHSRRTNDTNKFDLCTALILISYGLLITIRRMIGPRYGIYFQISWFISFIIGSMFLLLRLYEMMVLDSISYSQHMNLSINIAATSSFLWIVWALFGYDCDVKQVDNSAVLYGLIPYAGSRKNRLRMFYFQCWFGLSAMMEIFDFPPIYGMFDAHSLWHACTVPLGFYWYIFLQEDAKNQIITFIKIKDHTS